MPKLKPLFPILALCLAPACGPANHSAVDTTPDTGPARPIPTHVLTEERAGAVTEAEAGDWIEVHLPEPNEPVAWEQRGRHTLEPAGPAGGEVRETDEGPMRVFRYRTLTIGRTAVTLALVAPEPDRPPRRELTFTVEVR